MALEATKGVLLAIGDYDLLEKIADGGMGSVFKGRNRATGEIVAIKIVPPNLASNTILVKRFELEYTAAAKLDHPNIVRGIDFKFEGSTPYLVMEYVDGPSLGQKIEREGAMPEAEAIRIIAQVAQGLYKAHKQGMIHRDVKPDNVLLTSDGQVKLADLGLVKETEADMNLTRTGRGLGTPHFMAPEQFRNAKNADIRCDIYSLGATLYMMVTGELPFRSCGPLEAWMKKVHNEITPPKQIVPGLSERVDWAIRRAMSAEADRRPANCREFVEDLTGRSTRRIAKESADGAVQDLWFLVYKDEEGVLHTVKGSLKAIRRSLQEGLLGDASNVRASREKTGPFEPLRDYPEFRDMVVSPAALSVGRPSTSGASSTSSAASRQQKVTTPPSTSLPGRPTPRTPPTGYRAPHIDLTPAKGSSESVGWGIWLLMLGVALGTALLAILFLKLGKQP